MGTIENRMVNASSAIILRTVAATSQRTLIPCALSFSDIKSLVSILCVIDAFKKRLLVKSSRLLCLSPTCSTNIAPRRRAISSYSL